MAIKQTSFWKFRPDLPYMTGAERSAFKELMEGGAISVFRVGRCERCGVDIPKTKQFCSIECAEPQQEEENDNKDHDGPVD